MKKWTSLLIAIAFSLSTVWADEALGELFESNASAQELYDKATGKRTYMKMGTGGIGLGLGGKKYQVIFLFETEKRLQSFIDKGWKADTSASAAAGTAAAGVQAQFQDGIAYYQITESGLIASADIAGTKYWKNKKLNGEN